MIQIVADTASLLNVNEGKNENIHIVPLQVMIAGKTFREFEEINSEQFYEFIKQGHLPRSSQPAIGEILEAFELANEEDDVLYLSIADGLSGAYQSACMAQQQASHPQKVHVVNTKTLCGPMHYLVMLAKKLRDEGRNLHEIIDRLQQSMNHCHSYLIPQDFDYLKRNGRLTPIAAKLGGMLKIKPVLVQTEDGRHLDTLAIARNFNLAISNVIKDLKRFNVNEKYVTYVSHAFAKEQAELAIKKLKEHFPNMETHLLELSPAFITQGGPQTIAIQSILK